MYIANIIDNKLILYVDFFCARNKSWANNVDFLKGMENLPDDSTFLNHTRQTRKKESRIKKGFAHTLQYKEHCLF